MKKLLGISLIYAACTLISCTKHTNTTLINHGKVVINISHKVDESTLIFDTVAYTNQAQNKYSVERLQYYLSSFKLYKGGKLCYSGSEVIYIDARNNASSFDITPSQGLETGNYDSISFFIGVDSILNVTNALPQTLENIDMGWPDMMGGGYHFLKLEGHWNDSGSLSGYALHIGENGFQVRVCIPCALTIPQNGDAVLKMTMNVNEWFRNPYTYNFSTDGVFSMGDTTLMRKLGANGADVFYSYQ